MNGKVLKIMYQVLDMIIPVKQLNPIKDAYGWKSANAVWMKGRDFSVTYVPQNTNSGDVKVVLTGINNYAGRLLKLISKLIRLISPK